MWIQRVLRPELVVVLALIFGTVAIAQASLDKPTSSNGPADSDSLTVNKPAYSPNQRMGWHFMHPARIFVKEEE